jgi:DNA-binding CsgD family transcriptional regulator
MIMHADWLERACVNLGDAVIDPAIWPKIIDQMSTAVGATGAVLRQGRVHTPDVPHSEGVHELVEAYFANGWHLRDLRAERGIPLVLKGKQVVTDQDIVTLEEMRRFTFYNELLTSHGFEWFAWACFWVGSELWGLSFQRTKREGPFETEDKRTLAQLSQRLTEVASLSAAVGHIALSSATNAMNAVRQPAIAVDRLGFVLNVNPDAAALFDANIYVKNKRLIVADTEAKACIENLIDRLRVTSDMATLPCDPIIIRRHGKSPVISHILPVHAGARTPFLGARVLLALTAVEPRAGPKAPLLTRVFGLTRAEARLAAVIAEGLSPERAAEKLGISKATARNHLLAVFAKTATHRQGELIAMLSRL